MDTPVLTCEACGNKMFTDAAYFHTKADCVEVLQARLAEAETARGKAEKRATLALQRAETADVRIATQLELIRSYGNKYFEAKKELEVWQGRADGLDRANRIKEEIIFRQAAHIEAQETQLEAAISTGAAFLQAGVRAIAAAGAVIFPPRLPETVVAFEGEGWVALEVGVDYATGSDVTGLVVCDGETCAAF